MFPPLSLQSHVDGEGQAWDDRTVTGSMAEAFFEMELEDRSPAPWGLPRKSEGHSRTPGWPSARRTSACFPNDRKPSDLFFFEPTSRDDTSNGSRCIFSGNPADMNHRTTGVEVICFFWARPRSSTLSEVQARGRKRISPHCPAGPARLALQAGVLFSLKISGMEGGRPVLKVLICGSPGTKKKEDGVEPSKNRQVTCATY